VDAPLRIPCWRASCIISWTCFFAKCRKLWQILGGFLLCPIFQLCWIVLSCAFSHAVNFCHCVDCFQNNRKCVWLNSDPLFSSLIVSVNLYSALSHSASNSIAPNKWPHPGLEQWKVLCCTKFFLPHMQYMYAVAIRRWLIISQHQVTVYCGVESCSCVRILHTLSTVDVQNVFLRSLCFWHCSGLCVGMAGSSMEEKYSEDNADSCDGRSCGAAEEWLRLCCCFYWQVLSVAFSTDYWIPAPVLTRGWPWSNLVF